MAKSGVNFWGLHRSDGSKIEERGRLPSFVASRSTIIVAVVMVLIYAKHGRHDFGTLMVAERKFWSIVTLTFKANHGT